MTQPRIDWDRDVSIPVQGRTLQARHAGATGAQQAAKHRGALSLQYMNLLAIGGSRGFSDYEAAEALGRGVSSMTSTRAGLGELIVPTGGYEVKQWPDGGVTKRARYVLAKDGA